MMEYVKYTLQLAITVLYIAIIGSVLLSYLRLTRMRIPYRHPLVQFIDGLANLMLAPIQRAFSTTAGGLDFSPVIALVILSILRAIIIRL